MLYILRDTPRYQKLLREDHGAIPLFDRAHPLPPGLGHSVVTGDKTPDYGGGASPYGFVMDAQGKVIGRVLLSYLDE